ncbi:MAG: tRNA epoxyqueuosine(34) reductase QueG [Rhodospirillaceae bacterium]|nr:tRNA epoxyqueuosine(34) reductase QueG [Rhodospirillaceae bacterium]
MRSAPRARACQPARPADGSEPTEAIGAWKIDPRRAAAQPEPETAERLIRTKALELGFDAVGIAPAELPPEIGARLAAFLDRGYHGDMGWMAETAARRASPTAMWPAAKSAVVLGVNYGPHDPALEMLERPERANVSVYARNADYHDTIKKRLKALARWMQQRFGGEVKVFVDTAPLMEKPLAERAGLGWQGKHTNLVSRDYGSWLFLGCVLTTLDLAPDAAEADHCGQCGRCLEVCPTEAFPAPYRLDASRCISYLTIEHKGHIPREFRAAIGNRVYGCDDCLAVCPWNKFAQATKDYAFIPRLELTRPKLIDYVALDDAGFRHVFRASPIKRIGRDRFVRNILIAIGNSRDAALGDEAENRLADPSPLVRAAAIWALSRLRPPARFAALAAQHAPNECDPDVKEEWKARDAATP